MDTTKIICYLALACILLASCVSYGNHPSPSQEAGVTATPWLAPTIRQMTPVRLLTQAPTPEQLTTPQVALFDRRAVDAASLVGISGFPPGINPLTGLAVDDQSILRRRPVMVKVSNYPRSGRPHAGLSFADIVFEYYIGEEANRFLAVYYGQDCPKVGPIRSGRLVDAQLVNLYGGILVYGNADPKVDEVLEYELGKRAFAFNQTPCPPVCGKDTHSVTGVFADTAEMTQFAVAHGVLNQQPDLRGMVFARNFPQSDTYAIKVGVEYSQRNRGEWLYDPATGLYLRWIEDKDDKDNFVMIPLVDRLTGQQLAFANVIILFAEYIEYAPTLHQIDLWGNHDGQRALIFRDAVLIEGKWEVYQHNQPIRFYNMYGLPIALKPGNTWIVIAGLNSSFEERQPGQWELHFALP